MLVRVQVCSSTYMRKIRRQDVRNMTRWEGSICNNKNTLTIDLIQKHIFGLIQYVINRKIITLCVYGGMTVGWRIYANFTYHLIIFNACQSFNAHIISLAHKYIIKRQWYLFDYNLYAITKSMNTAQLITWYYSKKKLLPLRMISKSNTLFLT